MLVAWRLYTMYIECGTRCACLYMCAFAIFRHFKAIHFELCVCAYSSVFYSVSVLVSARASEMKKDENECKEWKNKHQNKANSNRLCVFCAAFIWIVRNSYIRCLFYIKFQCFSVLKKRSALFFSSFSQNDFFLYEKLNYIWLLAFGTLLKRGKEKKKNS